MSQYRKKPVVIDAIQWDGSLEMAEKILKLEGIDALLRFNVLTNAPELAIKTLEGIHNVSPQDYIIKGVKGEYYPCKPDIFEATYNSVDSSETFLDRMKKEKEELDEKLLKLNDFIENNPKFNELSNINRILLVNQFNAMELYKYALDSRIEYIND